jgi:hypothetical protein
LFYLVKNLPTSTITPRSPLLADADDDDEGKAICLTWEEGGRMGCHTETSSIKAVLLLLLLLLLLELLFLSAALVACATQAVA